MNNRFSKKLNPEQVYMILRFSESLFFSMIFTVNLIYQVTVAELNPLQLVLLGTIVEATVFIFEIPTGVVADVVSRRLSVIIGYTLVGLGFMLEGAVPIFWTIGLAQVLWGVGFTFTSGATQAWVVDEMNSGSHGTEPDMGQVFLRGSQVSMLGGLIGIPVSMILGSWFIQLPIVCGGGLLVLLALFLWLTMSEEGFKPTPKEERDSWRSMGETVQQASQMIRQQRVMLLFLAIGLFFGLYSEGFDRLWTAHILENFTLPKLLGVVEPVIYFGVIHAIASVIGIFTTGWVRRRLDTKNVQRLAHFLMICTAGISLGMIGFAMTRHFWVALLLFWLIGTFRRVVGPLRSAWFNQQLNNPKIRATMFSVLSQVDAIGQVGGGPVIGWVGKAFSIRWAIGVAACILAPVIPIFKMTSQGIEQGQSKVVQEI